MSSMESYQMAQGRAAYYPGGNPKLECPYVEGTDNHKWWMFGWTEGQNLFDDAEEFRLEQNAKEDFTSFASECPWANNIVCLASSLDCRKSNCGLWRLKEWMES